MKLYVHLIYLLGVLCFWEMVIQPDGIRHEVRTVLQRKMNNLSKTQITTISDKIYTEIRKERIGYESPSSFESECRSYSVLGCLEESFQKLEHLKRDDFWQFRTACYESFLDISKQYDRESNPLNSLMISQPGPIKTASKLLYSDMNALRDDFKMRLLLASVYTETVCLRRMSGTSCFSFRGVYPEILCGGFQQKVDEKVALKMVVSGYGNFTSFETLPFNSVSSNIESRFLRIDTIMSIPGNYKLPFQIFYRTSDTKGGFWNRQVDIVDIKVYKN